MVVDIGVRFRNTKFWSGPGDWLDLKATKIEKRVTRKPFILTVPFKGMDGTHIIDHGEMEKFIFVTGYITPDTVGGRSAESLEIELDDAVRNWWGKTELIWTSNPGKWDTNQRKMFNGSITKYNVTEEAGEEEQYAYTIEFRVRRDRESLP